LFKTMEIVVDEKPLALATSRIVAAERFKRLAPNWFFRNGC